MSSKYRQIRDAIVAEIEAGAYPVGGQLPTEFSLAQRYEVSRQTVIKALDDLKEDGILVGRPGQGTFVARARAIRRERACRQIGFVCSNLQDGFGHAILLGAEAELGAEDCLLYACNTANSPERENQHLRRLHDQGADGVILFPYAPQDNAPQVRELSDPQTGGMRVVCVDRGYPGLPLVRTDHRAAVLEGMRHLLARGHRRIGFLVNSREQMTRNRVVAQRYEGYRQALAEAGVCGREEWVQDLGESLANRRPREVGLDLYGLPGAVRLLSQPERPTAILLLWDELAPGALAAIRSLGLRCPQDVSLLGFNDDELCELCDPPLTTLRQSGAEIGRLAARTLLRALAGQEPEIEQILPAQLVVRGSVAPVAG